MARSDSGESVIERVVRIFDAFDPQADRLTLGEIARRASLPVSTAQRLVDQLVEHRLLHRDAENKIGIAVRMWELASRASPTSPLREAALPYLEDLHAVICPGHIHIDATGIAVPVLDRTGNVVAAISAVVPHEPQAIQTLTVLQAAARGIRRALSTPEDGQGLLNDG